MKINKSGVKIGCDFEMFLSQNGKIMSAIPFNQGTKSFPEELDKKGCCIQRDGVLQECNLPAVSLDSSDEFWENTEYVKSYIMDRFARREGFTLECCPTANLDPDQLVDPEAREFGCSPDFDCWRDGDINEKNLDGNTSLRSCGGHIHLSIPEIGMPQIIDLMKLFDVFLTVPFVLIDKDKLRRKLYGNAGSFRPKYYGDTPGFEARTLSNLWISEKAYVDYVFNQLSQIFDYYDQNPMDEVNKNADVIVKCINNSDEELAKEILTKFNVLLPLEEMKKNEHRILEETPELV